MMMRTLYLGSALAVCGGVVVYAQNIDTVSPLLGFYKAGVLCAIEGGVVRDAPNTVAGSTHVVEDAPPFVSEGRLVPAVIGVGFGVRAGIQGTLGQDNVVMTVTHPPLIGNGQTKQSFSTSIGAELTPGITFYQFDYPYELALGDWTMTARSNGVTYYETTFTVVPPETLPELASVCGYTDLFS
ncbi:DUF3859 domain-containing protein [Octadecabacter sp. 1_MG-2023]|uniref:DUF3859 domain-containing protein n=1 Tax=unclassified Octadecabacter TaxID=196158 RepID=UPI001C08DAE3|nr:MULTISPECIES: DUF3859 domain-containing protein [unclassified Octadecabacter]MBU2992619.1 DUF3859 domain-containing protein [Octadecabacter sp. B2R22]MDO6734624.1 DUF3859 domain-containing protein [Octadecabacter sp. 1_MG-2023]